MGSCGVLGVYSDDCVARCFMVFWGIVRCFWGIPMNVHRFSCKFSGLLGLSRGYKHLLIKPKEPETTKALAKSTQAVPALERALKRAYRTAHYMQLHHDHTQL